MSVSDTGHADDEILNTQKRRRDWSVEYMQKLQNRQKQLDVSGQLLIS